MPGASPGIGYGLTETNALGANNNGDTYVEKPSSTGFPLPLLMDLRVIDDSGNVLNENENGEVCIKSAATFRCYWKNQEATDECLDGCCSFIDWQYSSISVVLCCTSLFDEPHSSMDLDPI